MVAAEATDHLGLGPLVLNNEFYNPALLARTVATVDQLTGGRLVLGLGTGYSEAEHDAIGIPIRAPGPRVSRFEESLMVLRALLDEGAVEHDGEFESVHFDDLGSNRCSLTFAVGGRARPSRRWNSGPVRRHVPVHRPHPGWRWCTNSRRIRGQGSDRTQPLVDRGGRDRDQHIERSALVQFVACGKSVPSPSEIAERFEVDESVIRDTPFVLVGSVEQIIDKIERLREQLGITHYIVRDAEAFAPIVDALAGN